MKIHPKRTLTSISLLIFGFLLVACNPTNSLDEPPEIIYGQDVCDECSMIINEARYAASYGTTTGDIRRFDDIGNMLLYTQKHSEDVHVFWLHDFNTKEWINAERATLVLNPDLVTPMAWGLAAFAMVADAEAYVAEFGGTSSTFAELLHEVEMGAINPELLAGHVHGDSQDMSDDTHEMSEDMNHEEADQMEPSHSEHMTDDDADQ